MGDKKYSINKVGFPDPLSSESHKETKTFGLEVQKAIEGEWFRRYQGDCKYYGNRAEHHRLRLYARGEQPISKYKNEIAINGDLSHINLDWTPIPIIPKFVDIIVNGMEDRLYSIKATSVDKVASDSRNKYITEMEKDMLAKEMLMQAKNELGVDAFVNDPKTLPRNNEELEVHMRLNYKQGIEIAEEEAIKVIFEDNDYDDIKKRITYDSAVLGVGFGKHDYNSSKGIVTEYVDPSNMVYSYTESPYFEDCYYFGEVKKVPISQLKNYNPNLTNEELEIISNNSSDWDNYHNISRGGDDNFDDHTVNLLFFNYKTNKELVWKKRKNKRGGSTVTKKESDWNPPTEKLRGSERISRNIDVWYDGISVLGTDIILRWELLENMVRPKSSTNKALPNYIACAPRNYNGTIESQVRRMIPFGDAIQLTHLKLQQVVQRVVPDGVFIDADGLNEVNLGDGNAYNPKKALELYFQTGSVVGRSQTSEGEFNHGKIPIQELSHNSGGNKIQSLITVYNYNLQMIRDVTGINEARDASMPDSRTLVGVQKLAALNSNTATRHILNAGVYITKKLAEALSYRISDALEDPIHREKFIQSLGRANVSILDDMKDLHLHDFGIYIELSPDAEEAATLEGNIQQSLAKDQIYLEDAIDVRQIDNLKLANQLLKIRRKSKLEEDMAKNQHLSQTQTQSAIAATQAKLQASMKEIEAKALAQIQIDTNLKQLEAQNTEHEAKVKETLMIKEFELNMIIRGQDAVITKNKEEEKEDRKDERTRIQATQQSKQIKQREVNGKPINFESNEDSLDGFNLSEFEPS